MTNNTLSTQYMSKLYAPTLKEVPTEAVIPSHQLLLRAGYIRKLASGLYSYLPLAMRVLNKLEAIVQEELAQAGAQEVMLPILSPVALWEESGRAGAYGPELMQIEDRHGTGFILSPTHEEMMVHLVRSELNSYRQLPLTLVQTTDKFRDEIRPRFGLMRSREFIMNDAYSFDQDEEQLDKTYHAMGDAYQRINERVGLHCVGVSADSGEIGGSSSIEYMALAEEGEAQIIYCPQEKPPHYAEDIEMATAEVHVTDYDDGDDQAHEIATPSAATIEEVSAFFDCSASSLRKSIALVSSELGNVVVFLPGSHDLNPIKAAHIFGDYHLMSDEELEQAGLVKGFIGPVNLPAGIITYADNSLKNSNHWLVGANKKDAHIASAQPDRDFTIDSWENIAQANGEDTCPHCHGKLEMARGIEVSQIFKLGDKYSKSLNATFLDKEGKQRYFEMGCYGIGVSRMLASVVAQNHDENGIFWPPSIAPYQVEVLLLDPKDTEASAVADQTIGQLQQAGLEILVDDREDVRPGAKFAEADLLGMPVQLIIGRRNAHEGNVELKCRKTGERDIIPAAEALAHVQGLLQD